MKKTIVTFTEEERTIIDRVEATLDMLGSFTIVKAIQTNEQALHDLARSISQYPSVFDQQQLGDTSRSVKTLINNLCISDITDLVYHIPTKAILGQGFTVAKINFFFMILYSMREKDVLHNYEMSIHDIIRKNVYTSMSEEVFLAIISDKKIPVEIRSRAGYRLADIWEYRLDPGVKGFAPILTDIWNARKVMKPAFGTMMGLTELFQLAQNQGQLWHDFLDRDGLKLEEVDSLHEFLLGLSFEERENLQRKMDEMGKTTFSENDIRSILGNRFMYTEYDADDSREIFRSFKQRKRNADFRKRANLEGPKKTIEEYLMLFLLSLPEAP